MTQQERVTAGIAWLDTHPLVPSDWREHVRPDSLSVVSPSSCVLAQLAEAYGWDEGRYSGWSNALDHLWPDGADDEDLSALGFLTLPGKSVDGEWVPSPDQGESIHAGDPPGTLTAAWREALSSTPAV